MKLTPEEKKIYKNFLPGALSKTGFIGQDTRHIHEIVAEDLRVLSAHGTDQVQAADRLQFFIDVGRAGLENPVDIDRFTVEVRWARGRISCPFSHPGVYPLIHVKLKDRTAGTRIIYSQLSVHLIRQHGFFGGIGSIYRINPLDVIELMKANIQPKQKELL
jgi:hypothetical protein